MTEVIRVYDWVEILDPRFFVRCGYPLDLAAEQARLQKEQATAIHNLLYKSLGWADSEDNLLRAQMDWYQRAHKGIAGALAFAYVKGNRMGGRERQLYLTDPHPHLAGKVFQVLEKKMVRTGKYYPPSGSEDEYDPGGLTDSKLHVILHVSTWPTLPAELRWIPAAHVKKAKNPYAE